MSRATVPGFDYVQGKAVERSRGEWLAMLSAVIADGGRRRVEHGETFAHGADARIRFEVYTNLPAP